MASRWKHDINQNFSFDVSNIPQGNVDIQKSASTQPYSQKIMRYYEDKTIRKKTTAALLLYTQKLEHDKFIMPLTDIWFL